MLITASSYPFTLMTMKTAIIELFIKMLVMFGIYKTGKNQKEKERLEERLEAKEDARKRKQEIDRLNDAELDERLREWEDG